MGREAKKISTETQQQALDVQKMISELELNVKLDVCDKEIVMEEINSLKLKELACIVELNASISQRLAKVKERDLFLSKEQDNKNCKLNPIYINLTNDINILYSKEETIKLLLDYIKSDKRMFNNFLYQINSVK